MKKIAVILLAAGQSKRMGRNKLLLPIQGETLVRRTAECILQANVGVLHVVTGFEAAAVESELAGLPVRFARNAGFAGGMLSSLKTGLASLSTDMTAAIVVLADQIYLDALSLRALAEAFRDDEAPELLVPLYGDQRGHPVLIARRFFAEVLRSEADPEKGAQFLFRKYPERVGFVARPPSSCATLDLDTPADYEKLSSSRFA